MGKGFNNYMCKKFFHPASRDNLKRVWMAEQQSDAYKKKQEELRVQYEKEQDLYTNKAMMSKESKEKLSVNFLYEPPPGTKKDREREDDEPEFKFEWQRKYNAPRESYCKGDSEIRDQPFGIQVRNVRCIKCHKWGHINTDKECPMYNQSATGAETGSNLNPSELIRQMRDDGLAMKKGAVGLLELPNGPSYTGNHQLIPSSSEDDDHMNESELKFLEGLSTKKKLKLLRKLEKMEKKKKKKKHKKDKKRDGSKRREDNDSESESDSDSSKDKKKKKKSAKNGEDSFAKPDNGLDESKERKSHNSDNKDVENELYTVLGRKMDFDGPPQNNFKNRQSRMTQEKSLKGRNKYSRSRSNSRGRSRSRSPVKSQKNLSHKLNAHHENQRNRPRRPESPVCDRPNSPRKTGLKSDKRSRGRPRSRSRGRSTSRERRRSRSRSREHQRRSRSPGHRSSNYKHH